MLKYPFPIIIGMIFIVSLSFPGAAQQSQYDVSLGIKAEAPGTVFTINQPPTFNATGKLPETVSYEVRNHQDKIAVKGNWHTANKLVLPSLPCGYYHLNLHSTQMKMVNPRSFAVVADPTGRPENPAMPYAVDSAQSWLCRPDAKNKFFPGDANALVSRLAYLAGIKYTRERLSWNATETQKAQFRWQNYVRNAEMLSKYGIKISGMFHDSPKWTRTTSTKFPDDLKALYDYGRTLSTVFKGKMADWEFWNEQDIGFSHEGAWDYVACMKAAYLGFKAGDRDLTVVSGAFCNYPFRPYIRVAFENDLADYFDVFNFHTYSPLESYPNIVDDLHKLLNNYHAGDKPIWITECGILGEGMGKVKSGVPGLMAHSPEQEITVAEFLPKSQITMQSLGIAKCFFFVLPPYNEQDGNKDWGLLRRDYTAKAGYVALSTLIDQLGAAAYVGTLDWGKNIRAFLFRQPDGSQSVAFWQLSELDKNTDAPKTALSPGSISLPAKPGKYRVSDFLGTPSVVAPGPDGRLRLKATRYPTYVNGLQGLKPVATAKPTVKPASPATVKDMTVILKIRFSPDFVMNAGKDSVDIKTPKGKLTLEVWNLSNEEKSGSLSVKGGTMTGIPERITVKPWKKTELACEFQPEFTGKSSSTTMEISGHFGGRQISKAAVPVMQMDRARKACISQPLNWTADPGSWKPSSSGNLKISSVPSEKAVKFEVNYPTKVDKWVYPIYVLQLPQESLRGAFGIAFEIKADGKPARKSVVMLEGGTTNGKKHSHWLEYAAPTAEWSERVVVTSGFDDLAEIKELKIGMNPQEEQKTFYLRNIRILFLP